MSSAIIFAIIALILAVLSTYKAYKMAFYSSPNRIEDDRALPDDDQYINCRDNLLSMIDDLIAQPYEQVYITSHDGLRLAARYYHIKDGAPLKIFFHGYRSTAIHDCCGGFKLCYKARHNALLIDQRAHGKSEGHVISFGVMEKYDCLGWVNYAIDRFGPDTKIILSGVSMGAATVLMASDLPLPTNVVCITSDSGYTSPKDIIQKIIVDMKLPVAPSYFFVRMSARLFGHFNLEESSAKESLKKCNIPVLFVHGEDDRFVPYKMCLENYAACASEKQMLTVPGAGHGLSFLIDEPGYEKAASEFLMRTLSGWDI